MSLTSYRLARSGKNWKVDVILLFTNTSESWNNVRADTKTLFWAWAPFLSQLWVTSAFADILGFG